MSEREKIPLNDFEQHLYEKYTRIRPSHPESEYKFGTLWFDSGVQHFKVTDAEFEDDHHADWFRRQFARALASMAVDVVEKILLAQKPITDAKH